MNILTKSLATMGILAISLVACAPLVSECECANTSTETTEIARALSQAPSGVRLRGPTLLTPRADMDSEHPHPQYPRILNASGQDNDGVTRMLRDFPRPAGTSVQYGLLHAHTWYSDGSGTPQEAFTRAASMGLDFLAVTPHNHDKAEMGASGERRDRVLVATNHDLMSADGDVTFERKFKINGVEHIETVTSPSLVHAAEQANSPGFIALVGQEFSSISSGNHVNVIGWNEVLTVPNGDFAGLYAAFGAATPVLQLNHPDMHLDFFYGGNSSSTLGKMFNDYGFDDFGDDFEELVDAADRLVVLVELLTGPAFAQTAHPTFHYRHHERDYYYYLLQGFHISPSVGHDNHFKTWGDATPARMGVFAESLTRDGLLSAMRANRTFATEDSDLLIEFQINNASMGDVLMANNGDSLTPRAVITDLSDAGSEYKVELIYGDVQPQTLSTLTKLVPDDGLTESFTFIGDGQLTFDTYLASGLSEFFYIRITQGDGDQAWTAPIWINHPRDYPVDNNTPP